MLSLSLATKTVLERRKKMRDERPKGRVSKGGREGEKLRGRVCFRGGRSPSGKHYLSD